LFNDKLKVKSFVIDQLKKNTYLDVTAWSKYFIRTLIVKNK